MRQLHGKDGGIVTELVKTAEQDIAVTGEGLRPKFRLGSIDGSSR